MSEPTLADVVERLERLERAIEALTRAVQGQAAAVGGAATARGATTVRTPALAAVAEPSPSAPVEVAAAAMAVHDPTARAEGSADDERAEPIAPALPGPEASIEDVLELVFRLALAPTEEEAWPVLAALTHPKALAGPRTLDHLKAFNWRKLRRGALRYLSGGDPRSFTIERTEPAQVEPEVEEVKIFLWQDGASPAPITLRRDERSGGAWRIGQISL